jgi:hypothetical protein
LVPPTRTWEQRPIIRPVGVHDLEDVKWNGKGHRTVVNMELGTMCRYLYSVMVFVHGCEEVARS